MYDTLKNVNSIADDKRVIVKNELNSKTIALDGKELKACEIIFVAINNLK